MAISWLIIVAISVKEHFLRYETKTEFLQKLINHWDGRTMQPWHGDSQKFSTDTCFQLFI